MYIILQMASQNLLPIARYSLVICRNNLGRFLCVHERDHKWWIPAGGVDPGETHSAAAEREALEETGIRVALKGILSFDQLDFGGKNNISGYRVIYYAEPIDQHAIPKQVPDKESLGAAFLTLEEILALRPLWRVPEIYNYPKYVAEGGEIFPLAAFQEC
jgi:phosphatase NudJ